MNIFEDFLVDLGLSFTFSKMLPYLFAVGVGGIFGAWVLSKSALKGWKLWTVFTFILIFPFSLYFAFSPIYQGDFSDNGYYESTKLVFPKKKTLIVVVLPGCQYCVESTKMMKSLRQTMDIQMSYWVVSNEPSDLKIFSDKVGRGVLCQFASDLPNLLPLTKGSFPTYLLVENGKLIKAWHNDTFGVVALDKIQDY